MKTRPFFIVMAACLLLIRTAAAESQTPPNSDVQAIRKEMQQLRDDYERRMQSLEQRLQQMETGTPAPAPTSVTATTAPATTNVAPVNNARGKAFAEEQFSRNTETRERALLQDQSPVIKERAEKVLQDFVDIGGYFRAGYGRDEEGGPQPAFQAPGAFSKYRLGNETENYGELILAGTIQFENRCTVWRAWD